MLKEFTPLKACIKYWPSFLGNASFLDKIGLTDYNSQITNQEFYLSGNVVIMETIEFPFLFLPNSTISILKQGSYTEIPFEANVSPIFHLSIPSIEIKLNLDYAFLIPVEQQNDEWVPKVDANGDNMPFCIGLSGYGISFNLDENIQFIPNTPSVTIDALQLGNTGIIASMSGVTPYFSDKDIENSNLQLPPNFKGVIISNADIILPKKLFEEPSIGEIPPGETSMPVGPSLKGENLIIGTGGLSGTLGMEGNVNLFKKIGNFWVELENFKLTFQQNAIVESNISGKLYIPKFKTESGEILKIGVKVHIGQNGEFNITADTNQEIPVFELENVFGITVDSLHIGRQSQAAGGKFYIGVGGQIDIYDIGNFTDFIPEKIDVKKLLIYDDGSFEFDGGGLTLPKAFELNFPPVKMSISAIHMGSIEKDGREYKYFGFDGGLSVNPGGVDARGKGVKLFFTVDDGPFDFFIRLESLKIDIVLPAGAEGDEIQAAVSGFLSIKDPDLSQVSDPALKEILKNSTEYAGSVSVSLKKFDLEISAAMRMVPKVPSFIIDLGIELPTPILLGTTGLGIYGFRGLFGRKYVATKAAAGVPEDGQWWQYYKAKIDPDYKEGIQVSKFSIKNGFSIGAGVSLATTADSGKVLSTKLFFMLSLPDVFLFQGQAAIMKERISLDAIPDPPFFAMIAISKNSIEAGFGANYKLPDDGDKIGKILTVDGVIEMGFFFGNSSAWYVNVGRDNPESMRIQARVLDIFNMYSYLMISNAGIKAGAGISYGISKSFGPLEAELNAYLDVSGKIAFRPKQIGGAIQLGGNVALSVCGFGFEVSAGATLAAEAPKPYIVTGNVYACVSVLGNDYCAKFEFTWNFDKNIDTSQVPLIGDVDSSDIIVEEEVKNSASATNIATGEIFPLSVLSLSSGSSIPSPTDQSYSDWIGGIDNEKYTVPMDSYIDIEFKKPLNVNSDDTNTNLQHLGGISSPCVHEEVIPPQKSKSTQVRHIYNLDKIEINYYDEINEEWKPYDFYNAILPYPSAQQHLA